MHLIEMETKYPATFCSVEAFIDASYAIPAKLGMYSHLQVVESYDHYYSNGLDSIRYRTGDTPQLTAKKKTVASNNFVRSEPNVPIAHDTPKEVIDAFCHNINFNPDFSIYKCSTIAWFDKFNTVIYDVYTDATKANKLGRFIEIEMSETHNWKSRDQAWRLLEKVESALGHNGLKCVSRANRSRKSLQERYTRA